MICGAHVLAGRALRPAPLVHVQICIPYAARRAGCGLPWDAQRRSANCVARVASKETKSSAEAVIESIQQSLRDVQPEDEQDGGDANISDLQQQVTEIEGQVCSILSCVQHQQHTK
jgi:hypothetical protein